MIKYKGKDQLSAVSLMKKKHFGEALEANNTSSQEVEEEAPKKRRM